jgi:predicted esterase
VLLGFSQGACLALTAALRRQDGRAARRLGGVIGFSGGLIGPAGTVWDVSGDFQRAPVLLGCSERDPHIPRDRVEETARVFDRMGAAVTLRLYPGLGHLVNEDERELARALLHAVAAPAG